MRTQIATINKAIGATSAIAAQCKQLVRDYLPEIIKQIQTLPLDQVCASIGLCPSSSKASAHVHAEVQQVKPSRRMLLAQKAAAASIHSVAEQQEQNQEDEGAKADASTQTSGKEGGCFLSRMEQSVPRLHYTGCEHVRKGI